MNLFRVRPRLKVFTDDLAQLPLSTTKIRIHGDVKNIARLREFSSLERLSVYTLNQQQLDAICEYARPRSLKLYEVRVADVSPLSALMSVEDIELDWNTKVTTLWDMSSHRQLRRLSINDFSKLTNITTLGDARQLVELNLSGGMWNKLRLASIAPLGELTGLRQLSLCNLSIKTDGLRPIARLQQLEELEVSNQFATEEYAYLSVALPHTRCRYFAPYVASKGIYPNKDIMPTGKGKPYLNSRTDQVKLDKLAATFTALQDKYRRELES